MSDLTIVERPKIVAKPWTGVPNPLSNTDQPYLKFVNSALFQEDGRRFLKDGYYTDAPFGSKDHTDYWDEQEHRVMNGYTTGGVRVTGRHYFYLNFCMIKARPIDPNTGAEKKGENRKIITLPRFLDHNYYWFNEFEKHSAEGPYVGREKKGMIIAKSRRKGFTYQVTGGVYGYNFNFLPSSMNILAAYEKGHYKVTLDGIHFTMNSVNKYTDWGKKRDKLNKRDHFRASYVMKNEMTGVEIEDGYMSEIQAVSFKDNPFKSIGESTDLMGFEEAGKFEHLLTAYTISEPTFRDGDIMTGTPLIWGTGGDMEKGTRDFSEMYYDPEPYGLASYENIYDENAAGECGWFIDDMWYYPGSVRKKYYITDKYGDEKFDKEEELPFVDNQGNSHRVLAEESLDTKRKKRRRGSRAAYNKFITQQPKTPAEAFLRVQGTMFDTIRASARLSLIMTNQKKFVDSIYKANLIVDPVAQRIKFEYNTTGIPLHEFPIKDNNKEGLIEIYEMPQKGYDGEVPFGRYIAGIDPYDDDGSTTDSVGSVLVLDLLTDRIVCHYKGRPTADTFFETVRRILKFYNAVANYERNKKGLYGYFYNKGHLHLLCDEPEILKDKGISKANTIGNNSKGTYASQSVNLYGLQRSVAWMNTQAYGEEDVESEVSNLDKIRSIPLLKEIIAWNSEDNFDDVSALLMLMIYREDRLQFKAHIRSKEIKQIANDPFFDRHVGGASNSYTNKTMMDFIKLNDEKN